VRIEQEGLEPKPTQETIRNIVNVIGLITIGNNQFNDTSWNDRIGVLTPSEHNGYCSFIASKLTSQAEYYRPGSPLAIVQFTKEDKLIQTTTKYIVTKEARLLVIDRYDSFWTKMDEKAKNSFIDRTALMTEEQIDKVRTRMQDGFKKRKEERDRVQKEEKAFGFSFVGESEAASLLELLKKLVN
jgi:hypothetical protein